ncbi:hypothetical protein B0H13DRAFT_1862866 [Mycena leptocephala]|nr:hypothetical protein B0H13DRAFT_1862866 [Mycena leptocephala]
MYHTSSRLFPLLALHLVCPVAKKLMSHFPLWVSHMHYGNDHTYHKWQVRLFPVATIKGRHGLSQLLPLRFPRGKGRGIHRPTFTSTSKTSDLQEVDLYLTFKTLEVYLPFMVAYHKGQVWLVLSRLGSKPLAVRAEPKISQAKPTADSKLSNRLRRLGYGSSWLEAGSATAQALFSNCLLLSIFGAYGLKRLYGVIVCLDVQFVDVIGKQPTANNFADGGKPRILFAGLQAIKSRAEPAIGEPWQHYTGHWCPGATNYRRL